MDPILSERSQIVDFYDGQTLFITGVTGFLGKILLCQLLEHCSDIRKIYLLIRGRQGQSAQSRFEKEVLSLEIFQTLLKQKPHLNHIFHVCIPYTTLMLPINLLS